MTQILEKNKTIDLYLIGSISTTIYGYKKLLDFFHDAAKHRNCFIHIHFKELKWIDANMTAILAAFLHKLKNENKLEFIAQLNLGHSSMNILFSNGFLNSEGHNYNNTGTSVILREFLKNQQDDFVNYVENDLLDHQGLTLTDYSKEIIINSMIEIYSNYEIHSQTEYPMFLCGQYYPKQKQLKFTIFDLGIGFLTPIQKRNEEIKSYSDAIKWALIRGNSTKDLSVPGGSGMTDLKEDMIENKGSLEVISGDAYIRRLADNGKEVEINNILSQINIGTCINLFFKEF